MHVYSNESQRKNITFPQFLVRVTRILVVHFQYLQEYCSISSLEVPETT